MKENRIIIIDEIRGIAIILMIIYHTLYSMEFIFGYNLGFKLLENRYMVVLQVIIGCLFIFISGVSSSLSKNPFKNGIKIGLASLLISLFTSSIIPSEKIIFGVLHFLATMMILIGIWANIRGRIQIIKPINIYNGEKNKRSKIKPKNIGEIFAILFVACYNIGGKYKFEKGNIITAAIGFPAREFYSADYYPLIPWAFLFLSGYYLKELFETNRIREFSVLGENSILGFLGKNSLKIYIVHQPIIIFFLFAIEILLK